MYEGNKEGVWRVTNACSGQGVRVRLRAGVSQVAAHLQEGKGVPEREHGESKAAENLAWPQDPVVSKREEWP